MKAEITLINDAIENQLQKEKVDFDLIFTFINERNELMWKEAAQNRRNKSIRKNKNGYYV